MTVDLAATSHPSDKVKLKEVIRGFEEPRIYTPPLRQLTPRTSHGFACIAFAEKVLGLDLMPWQKWMLIHALELRRDGSYRFRIVVCLVARQNGKTLVMQILALWHIYAKNSRWIMSTAQDLSNSEKAWNEGRLMARAIDELAEQIGDEKFQRGQKAFALREEYGSCTWFVKSANRKSGRGFSCELVMLDEIREHTDFECWAAVTKTTRARADAQIWCFSNAGTYNSVVLRHLRALGHRDLGWPDGELDTESLELPDMSEFESEFEDDDYDLEFDDDDDNSLGYFEYSADPRFDRRDPRGWAQSNPSLNHTEVTRNCVTTRVMKTDLRSDPPGVFDTECLCRWVATLDAGPFEIGSWDDTLNDDARFSAGTERVICIEVNLNRTATYVARCGPHATRDNCLVLDIAAARPGTHWVVDWLVRNRSRYTAIVIRGSGAPASSLVDSMQAVNLDPDEEFDDLVEEELGQASPQAASLDDVARQIPFMDDMLEADLPIVLWNGDDLGKASGIMYDRLSTRTLEHLSQPALDAAAKTAKVRVLRDSWVVDLRHSPTDAAPLNAGIGAVWGMTRYYTTSEDDRTPHVHTFSDEQIKAWEQAANTNSLNF